MYVSIDVNADILCVFVVVTRQCSTIKTLQLVRALAL